METTSYRRPLLLAGPVLAGALALGAVVLPELVYDRFIWQYFWGPIVADAAGQASAVHNGVTAFAGYTLINEIGYALILGYLLYVLVAVLKRFGIGTERGFVVAFVPFVVGGGVLRVVEDIAAAQAGLISPPAQYLLISPVIYVTMFVIVFTTLLGALWLERRGLIESYRYGMMVAGTVFTAVVFAGLLRAQAIEVGWIIPATLGLSTVVYAGSMLVFMYLTGRYAGVGQLLSTEKQVVLFGHLVDGSSTALSLAHLDRIEKHPIPDAIISVTGTPYAFLAVKLVAMSAILYYMNDTVREDDPLFFNLVLLGILSIGMGPGVRNMVSAFFLG